MNVLTEMGFDIPVKEIEGEDFLSLTAMCKAQDREPRDTIRNYVSSSANARYILAWNTLFNPEYTCGACAAGSIPKISAHEHRITVKRLIDEYHVTCFHAEEGKSIYAHHDIAIHFATWLNPEFGVYVMRDYQMLKLQRLKGFKRQKYREDARYSYIMLCDALRTYMVRNGEQWNEKLYNVSIAAEADMLNLMVFKQTAQQWRKDNPDKEGNMRDYADKDELKLLSYLETHAAILISCGVFDRACRESILAKRLEDGRWKKNYKRMKEAEDDFFTKRDSKQFKEMVKSTITEFAKGTLTIDDEGYVRDKDGYIRLAPAVCVW